MINAVFIINNQGKSRLTKFFRPCPVEKQQEIIKDIFKLISTRDDGMCNFIEAANLIEGHDDKLIYRSYATLYFVFCVDSFENQLEILDVIQAYVETLDKYFGNVCELDLVFNVQKAHYILNEIVFGGLVLFPDQDAIISICRQMDDIEKREVPVFYHETH